MGWFEKINSYYNSVPRLWEIEWVRDAVKMGKITESEFLEITGIYYIESSKINYRDRKKNIIPSKENGNLV